MAEDLQEDWLDTRLREETAYIDDDGFTARVVQKLPARRIRHSLRAAILIGLTIIASVIAYMVSGGGWFIAEGITRLALLPLPVICLYAAGATAIVMAGGLMAVVSRSSGGRLK
jgi:hypothetical protein